MKSKKKKKLIDQDFLNDFLSHFSWRGKRLLGAKKIWFGENKGKYMMNHDSYSTFIELYLFYTVLTPNTDDDYIVEPSR